MAPATALETPAATGLPLRIDEVMPRFDAHLVEHVVVDARPEETYRALLRADIVDNPVTRLLVRARDLPNALRRRATQPAERPRRITLRDAGGEEAGWVLLRDEPGVEFLVGLVGRFWRADYGIVRLRPEEFAAFDRPGYAKTVAGFSLHPHGADRTLLTYENRTVTTDEEARRRFRLYWLALRPFVAFLLRSTLASVKREAEHRGTRHAASGSGPLP
ncbi:hypothetical protein [Blastococcus sp. SYSU D01042]